MIRKSAPQKTKDNKFDLPLFGAVIALSLIGLVMVYDSSVAQAFKDFGDQNYYIKQQLIWSVLGYIALGFFAKFDYHNLRKIALPIFVGSVFLLLAVFIPGLGISAGGAHRWLRLGSFTIQPTEIIKLSSIIFFALLFERTKSITTFASVVMLITFILGILQKDLGSAIVYFLTSVLIFIAAGAPLNYFFIGAPVSLVGFLGLS